MNALLLKQLSFLAEEKNRKDSSLSRFIFKIWSKWQLRKTKGIKSL
jgi:hypothetical protein